MYKIRRILNDLQKQKQSNETTLNLHKRKSGPKFSLRIDGKDSLGRDLRQLFRSEMVVGTQSHFASNSEINIKIHLIHCANDATNVCCIHKLFKGIRVSLSAAAHQVNFFKIMTNLEY